MPSAKPSLLGDLVHLVTVDSFFAAGMFGVLARFREICVGSFEHRMLIAVPKLTLHRSISGLRSFVLLYCSLFSVLIFHVEHECAAPYLEAMSRVEPFS